MIGTLRHESVTNAGLTKEVWEIGDPKERRTVHLISYSKFTRPSKRHGWQLAEFWHWHASECRQKGKNPATKIIERPTINATERDWLLDYWRRSFTFSQENPA